jgi:hypothetical protein
MCGEGVELVIVEHDVIVNTNIGSTYTYIYRLEPELDVYPIVFLGNYPTYLLFNSGCYALLFN